MTGEARGPGWGGKSHLVEVGLQGEEQTPGAENSDDENEVGQRVRDEEVR